MTKIQKYTLGLDMGTNFIGWAVVEHDDNLRPSSLISRCARIFQEAVDAKLNQCRHVRYGTCWVSLR